MGDQGGSVVVSVAGPDKTARLLASLARRVTTPQSMQPNVQGVVAGTPEVRRLLATGTLVPTITTSRPPVSLEALADEMTRTFSAAEIGAFVMSRLPFDIIPVTTNEQMDTVMAIHEAEKASGRVQTEAKNLKAGDVYGRQVCVTRLPRDMDELHVLAVHVLRNFERYGHQRVSAIDVAGDAVCFDMRPQGRGWMLTPPTSID